MWFFIYLRFVQTTGLKAPTGAPMVKLLVHIYLSTSSHSVSQSFFTLPFLVLTPLFNFSLLHFTVAHFIQLYESIRRKSNPTGYNTPSFSAGPVWRPACSGSTSNTSPTWATNSTPPFCYAASGNVSSVNAFSNHSKQQHPTTVLPPLSNAARPTILPHQENIEKT